MLVAYHPDKNSKNTTARFQNITIAWHHLERVHQIYDSRLKRAQAARRRQRRKLSTRQGVRFEKEIKCLPKSEELSRLQPEEVRVRQNFRLEKEEHGREELLEQENEEKNDRWETGKIKIKICKELRSTRDQRNTLCNQCRICQKVIKTESGSKLL